MILPKVITATNLMRRLTRIIENAGVPVWEKLFQNLRASRSTELANAYPATQIKSWMGHLPDNIETEPHKAVVDSTRILGHSPKVCNKHYPLNLNENLHRVLSESCLNIDSSTIITSGAKCGAIVVQNVGMHCNATSGFVMQTNPHLATSEGLMPRVTICCEMLLGIEMPRVGIEPTTS